MFTIPTRLQLSWATGDYDIVNGLITGEVEPEGINLLPMVMSSPERHWRMLRNKEFDVCELSMSSYLVAVCRGEPFIAIPVFPHRRFRHSYIFCNQGSGIEKPSDLVGKRVGLRTFQNTAGLWMRGILEDEYGVTLEEVAWFTQDDEPLEFRVRDGLHLSRIPSGQTVDTMLVEGFLDAAIYPQVLPSYASGSPHVKRLFENPKAAEIGYYRKTGIFPIMHTVVISRDIVDEHPWVPRSLMKAFRQSLELSYKRMRNPRRVPLSWVMDLMEEQVAILGNDPWAPGLERNRKTLETLIRYSFRQGLIDRKIPIEKLFAESTLLDDLPKYV